jgi:nucleotide-binding universal stress UspA family protein
MEGDKMYNKIVIPLDGSKLAECALDQLDNLIQKGDRQEVVLVTVVESFTVLKGGVRMTDPLAASNYMDEAVISRDQSRGLEIRDGESGIVGKEADKADKYLHQIAETLASKGIKTKIAVIGARPNTAEAIVLFTKDACADLILMASHGRSGVSKLAFGNVADKVFRSSCVPILMVRPPGCVPGF